MSRTIIAVDPGLDDTGIAVFDATVFLELGATPQDALRAWLESGTIRTNPHDPLEQRISQLSATLHRICLHYAVDWGVVELPARPGGEYAKKKASRDALAKLHLATGAIIAVISSTATVTTQAASTRPKAMRQADLIMCHASVKDEVHPLPEGPRGGKREDEMDALTLGWWALISGEAARGNSLGPA